MNNLYCIIRYRTRAMALANSIQRLALGRIARIGQFYDARNDNFIPGLNVFTENVSSNPDDSLATADVDINLILGESIEEKCRVLDIDPELKLSILSGLVKVKSTNNFIIDTKKSAKISQMTLAYSLRTCSDEIRIKRHIKNIDRELLSTIEATHVVVAIEWGCNCYITCEHDSIDENSREHILEEMEHEVKLMKGMLDEDTEDEKVSKLKIQKNTFTYRCKSDVFSPDNIPLTFSDALRYARSLPRHISKINGGKGNSCIAPHYKMKIKYL